MMKFTVLALSVTAQTTGVPESSILSTIPEIPVTPERGAKESSGEPSVSTSTQLPPPSTPVVINPSTGGSQTASSPDFLPAGRRLSPCPTFDFACWKDYAKKKKDELKQQYLAPFLNEDGKMDTTKIVNGATAYATEKLKTLAGPLKEKVKTILPVEYHPLASAVGNAVGNAVLQAVDKHIVEPARLHVLTPAVEKFEDVTKDLTKTKDNIVDGAGQGLQYVQKIGSENPLVGALGNVVSQSALQALDNNNIVKRLKEKVKTGLSGLADHVPVVSGPESENAQADAAAKKAEEDAEKRADLETPEQSNLPGEPETNMI